MAEIILRLPSKAITYGYIEIKGTPEEFGTLLNSPKSIGQMYATYVGKFLEGEAEGLELYQKGRSQEAPPGDPQAASDRLDRGDKPRTVDEANEMAKQLIRKELGATEVSEHVHEFEYADDSNGHSGSFCECGEEESSAPPPWKRSAEPKAKAWEAADANTDW